jgi:hypothetical protein
VKKIAIVVALLGSCHKEADRSADHLRAIGYHQVACATEGEGEALCTADDVRFRCVTSDRSGCGNEKTACERFEIERSRP